VTLFDHRFNQGRRLGLLGGAVAPPKGGTAPPKGTAAPNLEMYMINYKMLKWSWHKRATTSDRGGGGGSEHGSFLPPPKECWNGVPGWVIRSSKSSRSILDAPDLRPGHRLPESSTKQGASCADLSTDDANSNQKLVDDSLTAHYLCSEEALSLGGQQNWFWASANCSCYYTRL